MQTTSVKSFVAALFVSASLSSQAQIYSIRVGSTVGGGTLVYQLDHDWAIGTSPSRFGLVQHRESKSSGPLITYTTIYFASREFTIQMPALPIAAIGVVAFSSFALLTVTTRRRIRGHQTNENQAA